MDQINKQQFEALANLWRDMLAGATVSNPDALVSSRAMLDQIIMGLRDEGVSDMAIGAYCMGVLVRTRTPEDSLLRILLVDGFK